jgi:arsenite-transporting ATPase
VRLVFFTGKGGVGKTTTAAATAAHVAALGRRVLVLSADSAHSLGDVLGVRLAPEPEEVAAGLFALEVDARAEMERHWSSIREYLVALFRHQGIEAVVADELALLPGAEETAALLAVEEHVRSGDFDLVVVDCAPTGSTLRLVTLPEVAARGLRLILRFQRALAAAVTPLARVVVPVPLPDSHVFRDLERLLYERLASIRELLLDRATSVRLVLTTERLVIDEAVRAHTDLCLFDLACDALVLNRLLPPEAAAEPGFASWVGVQGERIAEVESLFPGLPLLRAPLGRDEVVGIQALAAHGALLYAGRDPAERMADPARLRFARRPDREGAFEVALPLPHASREDLEVAKLDDALLVRAHGLRRAIPLPRRLARLALLGARLDREELVVRLGPARAGRAAPGPPGHQAGA